MELVKLNEAYTLTDNSNELWDTTGNVTKEMNGIINIGLNTLSKGIESAEYLGGVFFQISAEGNVSANYNFHGEYKKEYVDYCEDIIAQVLEQIK